ncbi:hypothetical protein PHAVU_008G160000 [Phaseolus vulgaris]|uniref:Uncharacterized protein n=1 Tax=Phaseolus vulgaris TaxID=3885 RepID=V7B956_PHAVU|nr:hypothetical protein PHAVU_008G160000g [Phaseolus vulgaris]ESW13006.1 hypothetical protein PHAVU_008G160000g [Phaseolus vulgaris]
MFCTGLIQASVVLGFHFSVFKLSGVWVFMFFIGAWIFLFLCFAWVQYSSFWGLGFIFKVIEISIFGVLPLGSDVPFQYFAQVAFEVSFCSPITSSLLHHQHEFKCWSCYFLVGKCY